MIRISAYDESVTKKMKEDGFAVVSRFFSPEQIVQLQDFFFETLSLSRVELPFFTTHWSSNAEYRKLINEAVIEKTKSTLDAHFDFYKCIFGYYLFKKPSEQGGVFMHKDWTLIDEEHFVGYTLWIPLVDTSIENGCFEVVPRSHQKNTQPRGSNISQDYPDTSPDDFRAVPVKAGDAIIFDHRLLHSSPPNLSETDRLAVGLSIVPKDAAVIHYFHKLETGETTRNEVGDDFLIKSFYDYAHKEPADYILKIIANQKSNNSTP